MALAVYESEWLSLTFTPLWSFRRLLEVFSIPQPDVIAPAVFDHHLFVQRFFVWSIKSNDRGV
jgi:hypothetical protein